MEWNIFKGFWDSNIDISRVSYSGDHTLLLPQWSWKSRASWVCPQKPSCPALDGNVSEKPIWAAVSYQGGFPRGAGGKESTCQCRRLKRHRFDPWVGKIPWSRKWHPTPVFLPGKFYGQRNLEGYSPWGQKESDTAERLSTSQHVTQPKIFHWAICFLAYFHVISSLYKLLRHRYPWKWIYKQWTVKLFQC